MKKTTLFLLTLTGISAQYPLTIFLFDYTFAAYMPRFSFKNFFFILFLGAVSVKADAQVLLYPKFTPEGLAKIKRDSFVKTPPDVAIIATPTDSTRKKKPCIDPRDVKLVLGDIGGVLLNIAHIPLSILKDFFLHPQYP